MPRRPREEGEWAIHHVFDRGSNRQLIFLTDRDRHTFLHLLASVTEEKEWNCLQYCLLDNHFHLVIETPRANLGAGMQRLLSLYAQTFNARHGRCDSLFGRRYGSKRIKDDVHLFTTIGYVATNPVKAGLSERPEQWRWGSHARIAAGTAPEWLAVDRLLAPFEAFGGAPMRTYRSMVEGAVEAARPGAAA